MFSLLTPFALWLDVILAIPFVFYAALIIALIIVVFSIDTDLNNAHDSGNWFFATLGSVILVSLGIIHFGIEFSSLKANLVLTAISIGGYFVVGVVWSFAKWYFHLNNVRTIFTEFKANHLNKNKLSLSDISAPMIAPVPPVRPDRDDPNYSALTSEYHKAKALYDEELAKFEQVARKLTDFIYAVSNSGLRCYNKLNLNDTLADPSLIGQSIKPMASKHKTSITEWIAFWPISFVWTMINDPVRKIVNYIFSRIKNLFQRMSDSMFAGI